MRLHTMLCSFAIVVVAGCGGPALSQEAGSPAVAAQADVAQADVATDDAPDDSVRRMLSPELPGDDPAFRAAIDAYDPAVMEQRMMAVTGLTSNDLGGGYFGQRFYMSLWSPVSPDAAMRVCHELVTYANELDFPATEIVVSQRTYADLEASEDLVTVDASGACVARGA